MLRDVVLTDIKGQFKMLFDVLKQGDEPLSLKDEQGNTLAILIDPSEYEQLKSVRRFDFEEMERLTERIDQGLQAQGMTQEDLHHLINEECEAYYQERVANS